jgi:exportin-2 (importin alpha re-exporter)
LVYRTLTELRYCGASPRANLLPKLWATFSTLLLEDVSEFIPFVFQIFSMLLESSVLKELPGDFKQLVDHILAPGAWETRGNVPPLARFLAAVMPKAADMIVAEQKLEPILATFQRLLAGKKTEQNAFDILEAVVTSFPAYVLSLFQSTVGYANVDAERRWTPTSRPSSISSSPSSRPTPPTRTRRA